jgi:O-acetyl-ADP-ribose deacetylase (regulator of RNase III)
MSEQGVSTLGLTAINSSRRGYPRDGAAHIAARATRRFLEKHGEGVDKIVFCVDEEDYEVYSNVLPMYFPRTKEETAWVRQYI